MSSLRQNAQRKALLKSYFPRPPARRKPTAEYCQLPVGVRAAIAARLTIDMLEVTIACLIQPAFAYLDCHAYVAIAPAFWQTYFLERTAA